MVSANQGDISQAERFQNPMPGKSDSQASNDRKAPSTLIVGPSHTVRWAWHVRDGVVPCHLSSNRIIGHGGAPIWSKTLLNKTMAALGSDEFLTVMVPDFRFGNGVCLDQDALRGETMQDGFTGIDGRAMAAEHDLEMFDRSMAALQIWKQRFGDRARYIFWCLFGRQVFDRLAGRHIQGGGYRHPVFNYQSIAASLTDFDIIDLLPLLRMPMHEVRRLFIDSSAHPSQIGYLLLNGLLAGLTATEAYRQAVAEIEGHLENTARQIWAAKGQKLLLTGRSIWLNTLMSYMGANGVTRLAAAGLVLAPLDPLPGQPTIAQLTSDLKPADCTIVILSAGGRDLSSRLAHAFGTGSSAWKDVPYIDWESATIPAITGRNEVPGFNRLDPERPLNEDAFRPDLRPDMVEQGPLGMPSWTGLNHIFDLIESSHIPSGRLLAEPQKPILKPVLDYRVEGDALVTEQGIAFLIGGNHSVLKYITGELVPTRNSLDAFAANIEARADFINDRAIPYLHIIFPDKQSVMSEAFPFQPICRLGDSYMAHLPPALRSHVLYPADQLRQEVRPTFLPLDTHMNDHGSLAVLRMMLTATGVQADNAMAHISQRISKSLRWPGDLGNKFTPNLYQESQLLDPDWSMVEFRSPGGFNDGMIDIVLNPRAFYNKTILLFGDSFFRMMLKHFSLVFSKIICLRTRFFHSEMISLIKPDYVFSGNAERYLSNVSPDTEAPAFFLYPHLRDSPDFMMGGDFLEAWSALTAPLSSHGQKFIRKYGIA